MKFFTVALVVLAAAPAAAFAPSTTVATGRVSSLCATADDESHGASRRDVISSVLSGASVAAAAALFPVGNRANADTYLAEPTEEFKESERQRMVFRKKQLQLKGEFVQIIARLTTESTTEDELIRDLVELRALVTTTGGLPLGIKKEELYKVIRGKKAKGFWPTNVEIAYQKFKSEVAYQQSPNTEKDLENPL